MRHCPNCGQTVESDADRFCPNCGTALAPAPTQPQATPSAYQPQAQPVYAAPQTNRPPAYADPTTQPNTFGSTFTAGGVSGGQLTTPRLQRNPTPVAPATGADPTMNFLMRLVRSVAAGDLRGMLTLAVVAVVAIFAILVIFKVVATVVAWFFGLWWLWLILIAIAVYGGRRRGRRGRLP